MIVTLASLTMAVLALVHHRLHPVKVCTSTVDAANNIATPIKHVVIIFENHPFNNIYGLYPLE